MEDIARRVRQIVVRKLNVHEEKLADEARLVDDLHATSVDVVEFIMSLEDEFAIEISDSDAEGLSTVGDAVGLVEKKTGIPAGAAAC